MLSNGEMGALFKWTGMAKANILLQPPIPSRHQMGKPKPPLHPCITKDKELLSDTTNFNLCNATRV